jgi:lipoprotein-anchoring transpeptidase ErfK/SrfK
MTDDELEHLLTDAFDAQARASVDDTAMPPAPRFTLAPPRRPHRLVRVLAPLTAAAAVIAVVVATQLPGSGGNRHAAARPTNSLPPSSPVASSLATTSRPTVLAGAPVHVRLLNVAGVDYGVGMPVIAYFSRKFTDAGSLQAATSVSVDGKAVQAAWYFERSNVFTAYPIEGHLRMQNFWPAHAQIVVTLATRNVTAGRGLSFDDSAQLNMTTGASRIATVSDATHTMTLTQDGAMVGRYRVSLGAPNTPTSRGTKVIMSQGSPICMSGPGYNQCGIKYTQRLTYSGEYLHAAPWNVNNIEQGIDSSNGCTNLLPADAKHLFGVLKVGDVLKYPDANGPSMQASSGYGDWDVPWSTWRKGGAVPTN